MLLYFWTEKEDPKRWSDYEAWAAKNPVDAKILDQLLDDVESAKDRVTKFLGKIEGEEE